MRKAVRQGFPQLERQARFLAVSFETLADLETQRRHLHEDLFEVCSDPGRRTYEAFGLSRVGMRQLLGWRTVIFYLRNALRGRVQSQAGSDVHQMGGDFILDRDGRVRHSYCSREPADRPDARDLVRELARWAD
ncbi:MAG: AhpC/TSA family protein [Candidatus Krumholzibacteriia bacterium]